MLWYLDWFQWEFIFLWFMVICYSLGELQKPLPVLTLPELGSCSLLRSFMSSELNSLVELTTEKGYSYFYFSWIISSCFLTNSACLPLFSWFTYACTHKMKFIFFIVTSLKQLSNYYTFLFDMPLQWKLFLKDY